MNLRRQCTLPAARSQLGSKGNKQKHKRIFSPGEQLLNDLAINSALQSFSIPLHFAWVWQVFALALAAWECQAWELANKCFGYALSEAKTNPVINQALADYYR